MFSLRREQFQAMLTGLVITDALCHGLLTWGLDRTVGWMRPSPLTGTSDRWCQHLSTTLDTLLQGEVISLVTPLAPAPWPTESPDALVEGLLSTLPQGLLWLDSRPYPSMTPTSSHILDDASATHTFYQALDAFLTGQINAAHRLSDHLKPQSGNAVHHHLEIISLALEQVLSAQGSFVLSLGQSLQCGDAQPSLPLLSTLFSAAWQGPRGIPVRWHQALLTPTPALRDWLHRRWQINGGQVLEKWAEALWHQWLGRHSGYPLEGDNPLPLAVQPICSEDQRSKKR